jgi:hypothetical protein
VGELLAELEKKGKKVAWLAGSFMWALWFGTFLILWLAYGFVWWHAALWALLTAVPGGIGSAILEGRAARSMAGLFDQRFPQDSPCRPAALRVLMELPGQTPAKLHAAMKIAIAPQAEPALVSPHPAATMPSSVGMPPPTSSGQTDIVFDPQADIAWPQRCIGCFSAAPQRTATLRITRKGAAKKGMNTGALLGGVFGAAVGAAIGEAFERRYNVPLCSACHSRLSEDDLERMQALDANAPPVVATPFLVCTVASKNEPVLLRFSNAAYFQAFRQANKWSTFESAASYRAAKERGATDTITRAREELVASPLDTAIKGLIECHCPDPQDRSSKGVYLAPDIPKGILANAHESCDVPPNETIVALFDCTLYRTGQNCFLFGVNALHLHWDSTIISGVSIPTGNRSIPYEHLAKLELGKGLMELRLGDLRVSTVTCPLGAKKMLAILETLKQLMADRMQNK